jgi:hypothetical protein
MMLRNPQDLPRHRYTGADPKSRPVWTPRHTGHADALLQGLIRQLFPGCRVQRLLIATPCEEALEFCMELDIMGFRAKDHDQAKAAKKRTALCARLALALLRPADYQPQDPRRKYYIHRDHWKMDDRTAHEVIESIGVLNQVLAEAGPEARFLHRTLLRAASTPAAN